MTEHHFETHSPIELYVENGKGLVEIHAVDTTESRVELTGPDAEDTRVDLTSGRLSVVAPKQRGGMFTSGHRLDMTITVPTGSDLATKLGSAELVGRGTYGNSQVRSGSGDVTMEDLDGDALLETGSGNVEVRHASKAVRIKSGSGDVRIRHSGADLSVSTGSGDVEVGTSDGTVSVKTGSGDLKISDARTDVALSTGSGDLVVESVSRGRLSSKGASGDVRIGVPAGVPVWTDITTVSGRIHSTLEGGGQPEDGADYVELRAKTVSGDIVLNQI